MTAALQENFNYALGKRLSMLRQMHKMSLEDLGSKLGVSAQQVHKYETGANTLMPKRIQLCAHIFKVPVGYFYGEDDTDIHTHLFDKTILTLAAEIRDLPDDIRKGIFQLLRQINKKTALEITDNPVQL